MAYRNLRSATGARIEALEEELCRVEALLSELEPLVRRKRDLDRELDVARQSLTGTEVRRPELRRRATSSSVSNDRDSGKRSAPRRRRGTQLLFGAGLAVLYAVIAVGQERTPLTSAPDGAAPCPTPAAPSASMRPTPARVRPTAPVSKKKREITACGFGG